MRNVLPGRPQSSRQALSTVNWDGLRLVAYISGNTVVIFNGRREILQSISVDDTDTLHCLIVNESSGHIAVSDTDTVYLYQPSGRDYGDLRWTRTCTLAHETEESISYLSWGSDDELLVAGERLTLWNLSDEAKPQVIWASNLSNPVEIACFSPDAGLIATCGRHDRLAKIWRRLSYEQDSTRFDVSYLPHPSAVTNISWRSFWHQEQSLDNVLYTFCADNHVYVWAHSEQHAYNIMQRVVTIDAGASIQPRRMSFGSLSKNRFVFMLGSRDLARAAERSLQTYRTGTDHALENFIQFVSRSPEICIVMDGLGHMSAWGIENAGQRNKQDPEKFNVALVDGVDIRLPSGRSLEDHIQIHAFANNDVSASLCILVHSYSGQIDWYQGSFVEFFDTASRKQRNSLLSCWSGHDVALEKMVSSRDARSFISFDEQDRAILWLKTAEGALVRKSRLISEESIIDALILGDDRLAVLLHSGYISIWDLRGTNAQKIETCELGKGEAVSMCQLYLPKDASYHFGFAILFDGGQLEQYIIFLSDLAQPQANGYHKLVKQIQIPCRIEAGRDDTIVFAHTSAAQQSHGKMVALSDRGSIKVFDIQPHESTALMKPKCSLETGLRASNVISSYGGRIHAFAHEDYRTISIWNSTQAVCEFTQTFNDMDSIDEMYWHCTESGQLVLAVQFPYNVVLVAQKPYISGASKQAWELLQFIRTRDYNTNHVNSICWLQPCQLILGMANQILTFDIEREHSLSNLARYGSKGYTSAGEYLALQNASLPVFDPELLGGLTESGQFSSVLSIFEALHEQLRFLAVGEELDHNLNLLEATSLSSGNVNMLATDKSGGIEGAANKRTSDFEDIWPSLEEGITKISEIQLSTEQKRRLINITKICKQLMENQGSMDSHALTYLYHFLLATSDMGESVTTFPPLPLSAITHASLSQTQESLTHFVLQQLDRQNIKLIWQNARALGIFLFTNNVETLREHLESVAKAEYNRNADDRNPVDCSLYYLALDKKAILQLLWRRTLGVREKENTLKLLARDFKDPKAKSTALKNAYALLSRRRFEYAAAFFLLGGSLIDAVNVCVNQMHDIQLAIAIARAWNGDPSVQREVMNGLLVKDIPNAAIDTHEARWYGIWACNFQADFTGTIKNITTPIDRLLESALNRRRETQRDEEKKQNLVFAAFDYRVNEPGLLLNMYTYIRTKMAEQQIWTRRQLPDLDETGFVSRCVDYYLRAGMDQLALRLTVKWQALEWQVPVPEEPAMKTNVIDNDKQNEKNMLDQWLVPDNIKVMVGSAKEQRDPSIVDEIEEKVKKKPPPTQFIEPSADSLLDSFGF